MIVHYMYVHTGPTQRGMATVMYDVTQQRVTQLQRVACVCACVCVHVCVDCACVRGHVEIVSVDRVTHRTCNAPRNATATRSPQHNHNSSSSVCVCVCVRVCVCVCVRVSMCCAVVFWCRPNEHPHAHDTYRKVIRAA